MRQTLEFRWEKKKKNRSRLLRNWLCSDYYVSWKQSASKCLCDIIQTESRWKGRWRRRCETWQLAVSSPLSVNRWKWAITPFDVARQNFRHPTSLLLLLDLSADFKDPHLLPRPSLSSHFNPLQQSSSVQSVQEHTRYTPKGGGGGGGGGGYNPNFFFNPATIPVSNYRTDQLSLLIPQRAFISCRSRIDEMKGRLCVRGVGGQRCLFQRQFSLTKAKESRKEDEKKDLLC